MVAVRSRIRSVNGRLLIKMADDGLSCDFEFPLLGFIFIVLPLPHDYLPLGVTGGVGRDVFFVAKVMVKGSGFVLFG